MAHSILIVLSFCGYLMELGLSPSVLLLDAQDSKGLELQAAVKSAWFKLRDGKSPPVRAPVDKLDDTKEN